LESREESSGNIPELLLKTTYEDLGQIEDELARKLRFSLIQRVYMECWKAPKACDAVGSNKRVEMSRKR
jgi:hypothetical protein